MNFSAKWYQTVFNMLKPGINIQLKQLILLKIMEEIHNKVRCIKVFLFFL